MNTQRKRRVFTRHDGVKYGRPKKYATLEIKKKAIRRMANVHYYVTKKGMTEAQAIKRIEERKAKAARKLKKKLKLQKEREARRKVAHRNKKIKYELKTLYKKCLSLDIDQIETIVNEFKRLTSSDDENSTHSDCSASD